MSVFNKYKCDTYTQNPQNSQNFKLRNIKSTFESFESIEAKGATEYTLPICKLVGRYESEEHLFTDLIKYPRLVPCPKVDWHWQDKERCYQKCRCVPKDCIFYKVAFYRVKP